MMDPSCHLFDEAIKVVAQFGLVRLGNLLPDLTGLEVEWCHGDWFSSTADEPRRVEPVYPMQPGVQ
jgi:hypothetical protein